MSFRIYSAHHRSHGLESVKAVSIYAGELKQALRSASPTTGFALLATCNRVEILLDSAVDINQVLTQAGIPDVGWNIFDGKAALEHLFRVAAGLDSMVVGEREIAGQLRRAISSAQDSGHSSAALDQLVQAALKTSRRIAHETGLAMAGRTVATVALDLVDLDWSAARTLIVGTGSYAGAIVADLRSRGTTQIAIHSVSGRGEQFAASHEIAAVEDLRAALAAADVVITCRGTGDHVITTAHLDPSAPIHVVDLALERDVEPTVSALPHVHLVTLDDVARHTAPGLVQDKGRADQLIADGLGAYNAEQAARALDPAVVQLRTSVDQMVIDEIARLPQHRALSADDAALALRRLAGRMLHLPSSRAREAAQAGRGPEALDALATLYNIEIQHARETV